MKLTKGCHKDSIVFITAIRYGIVISLSTLVAFSFPFTKPYWIVLSCAAVMTGSTIMSTFQRSIQRLFGTLIGVLLAALILKFYPQGLLFVLTAMCLTALIELFIVKNYAVAVMFITPNALLIAEMSAQMNDISYFVSDVLQMS